VAALRADRVGSSVSRKGVLNDYRRPEPGWWYFDLDGGDHERFGMVKRGPNTAGQDGRPFTRLGSRYPRPGPIAGTARERAVLAFRGQDDDGDGSRRPLLVFDVAVLVVLVDDLP
jgi:hypothetical protein